MGGGRQRQRLCGFKLEVIDSWAKIAATEYAKTLRFFFLDWMGKKSLVDAFKTRRHTLHQVPLPVKGNEKLKLGNISIGFMDFDQKHSRIFVVGHSRSQGRRLGLHP